MQSQGLVPFILPAHIVAGGLALVSGCVALMTYWVWRLRGRRSSAGIAGTDGARHRVLQGVLSP